jgi:hypothetical protein
LPPINTCITCFSSFSCFSIPFFLKSHSQVFASGSAFQNPNRKTSVFSFFFSSVS